MVDLLSRPLHAVSKPRDDVLGIVGINPTHMLEPRIRFGGIAGSDCRRVVHVKTGLTWPMDPAAVRDQAVGNDERLARGPSHLRHRPVLVEPLAGRYRFGPALVVELLFTLAVEYRHRRESGVDACRRPRLASRHIDVIVHRHIGIEVLEAYAFDRGFGRVIGRPLRFGLGAVHDVLNVIIVEPRMITTEKVHSLSLIHI